MRGAKVDLNLLGKEEKVVGILLIFSAKWGLKGDRKRKKKDTLGFTKKKRALFKKKGNQKILTKESRPNFLESGKIFELGNHEAKDLQGKKGGLEYKSGSLKRRRRLILQE